MKQDKYEKPSWIATGIAIGIWISLFVVLCVKCNAQDSANNLHKWSINSLTISKSETVQQDTIPVTILVRISGRPWAFFHDGWEVRKVDEDRGFQVVTFDTCDNKECTQLHCGRFETQKIYSHLLYLDSRKRPIRKEWVVYQTFKR